VLRGIAASRADKPFEISPAATSTTDISPYDRNEDL
jgi:hypothetical protein